LAAATLLLALAPAIASADSFSWSSPVALDHSGNGQDLNAVACPSTSQCTAVDDTGQVLTFNPGSPGNPVSITVNGAQGLNAIACPSTSQCTAVGGGGVAVTFNPASPGVLAPIAIDGSHKLNGVACPSSTQ